MKLKTIWRALAFTMTDHLLIRACMANEEARGRRGVLPPPPENAEYDVGILPLWARKTLDKIDRRKLFESLPANRLTIGLLAGGQYFVRVFTSFAGNMGVPLFFVCLGVLSGLAFLPMRIFTGNEITLPRMLIPLLLGVLFAGCQVLGLVWWIAGKVRDRDEKQNGAIFRFSSAARPYLRWHLNLAGLAFWLVVLATTGLEYMKHQAVGRDYFYQPIMRMDSRVSLVRRLNLALPQQFRLPLDSLAWADTSYRHDGYVVALPDHPEGRRFVRASGIGEYKDGLIVRLEEPEFYAESWFQFLLGVIIVFGFLPRVLAVPVFGLLLLASKVRLYREFDSQPYRSLLENLNARQQSEIKPERQIIPETTPQVRANATDTPQEIAGKRHRDVLIIAYEADVDSQNARRYGDPPLAEMFPHPAGDASTNREALNWLSGCDPGGKIVIICRLAWTPDNPFLAFVRKSQAIRTCELDFVESWAAGKKMADIAAYKERTLVWGHVMKNAGMEALLPQAIKDSLPGGANESN